MTIKCLAFDLDGTLLTDQKEIDPRTFASIQRAMRQGQHIVIASGRDKNGTAFVYEPLGLEKGNHYLALVNGQILYDFEKKEYDLDDVLLPEDGKKIQQVCRKFDVEGIFCCGYDFYSYISESNRQKKREREKKYGKPMDYGLKKGGPHRNFIDLPYKEITLTQDINKVILVHTAQFFEDHLEELKKALSDYDVLLIGSDWLEIMPKGVSKASALRKICQRGGFTMDEVMAFGDAQNDIDMIKDAGIGVAMANAMDEVKAVSRYITDSNNDNGIGKTIDLILAGKEMDLRAGNQ